MKFKVVLTSCPSCGNLMEGEAVDTYRIEKEGTFCVQLVCKECGHRKVVLITGVD